MGEALLRKWWSEFVRDMRASECSNLAEVLSDCSRELHVNTVVAQHLRRWGKANDHAERFWARSEWEYVDISFGRAVQAFDDWETAYTNRHTGDLGVIECKVSYAHLPSSDVREKVWDLAAKLDRVAQTAKGRKVDVGTRAAIVWWLAYDGSAAANALAKPLKEAGFRPVGDDAFDHVGVADLRDVWSMLTVASRNARLDVGLFFRD